MDLSWYRRLELDLNVVSTLLCSTEAGVSGKMSELWSSGTGKMDQENMSEALLEKKFRNFSKTGWNSNGSRMLAMASIVSRNSKKKLKKKFADVDIFLVFVLLSLAIKFLTMVPFLIICSLSVSYSVKKFVSKLYLDDGLEALKGDTQKILVLKLMDFCEIKNIDPESIQDLAGHLEDKVFCDQVRNIIVSFVNEDTKFYVL